MDDIRISLDTTGRSSELTMVRVDGVIDTMTASELERVMNTLLEQRKYKIIVDLAGVDYISSAGWGIFISNIREIKAHAGDIKLARMIPSVYEIFELLEFDSILRAYDNIEKAKADFRPANSEPEQQDSKTDPITPPNPTFANPPDEVTTEEYRIQPSTATQTIVEVHTGVDAEKPSTLDQELLSLVKADPFYSIRELADLLNNASNGAPRVGWWKVWSILRRHALLTRKSRFRLSRRG
jgi:anti-sigma B factor antagonist